MADRRAQAQLRAEDQRQCAWCEKPFTPRTRRQRFCSPRCKDRPVKALPNRICPECGKPGIEPGDGKNPRRLHIACARSRRHRLRHQGRSDPEKHAAELAQESARRAEQRAERYATDPEYRARVDVAARYSLKGRPPLERTVIRVLWTRYRLREPDYLRLLAWQNDSCPCGKPLGALRGKRSEVPHVDHDHRCCPPSSIVKTCGRCIRGLLHGSCNHLVGMIETYPDVIEPRGWVEKYLAGPPYQQMLRSGGSSP